MLSVAFGEPAELVAEGTLQLSLEGDEPIVKDRTWFCSIWSPFWNLCDMNTHIPYWCSGSLTEIFCPQDVGYEYDPVTGDGGSSGGGGAGRTWTKPLCLDSEKNVIPCPPKLKNICHGYQITSNGGVWKPNEYNTSSFYYPECNENFSCETISGVAVDCNMGPIVGGWDSFTSDGVCFDGGFQASSGTRQGVKSCGVVVIDYQIPFGKESSLNVQEDGYMFDTTMQLISKYTGLTYDDPNLQNGYPVYVAPPLPPPDPLDVVIPVGNEECGAICTWLSYIYNVMRVVNQSVLKVDASIQEMVSKMTVGEVPINSVLLQKLNDILTAIDKISFEMVKEAETNFWDVLGGAFGDIFDLIEFLIEKVIYLVIPEDTTSIKASFDLLTQGLKDKIKPIHDLQTNINSAVTVEDKEFKNIEINLPVYGVVPFYKVDYLLIAIPYIRMLLSATMIMMTSIWAYKKVSSELIK